jgi:hypothetical protein
MGNHQRGRVRRIVIGREEWGMAAEASAVRGDSLKEQSTTRAWKIARSLRKGPGWFRK